MSKIEELKQLMSIEGCNTAPDIKRHFDHIAKLLFECFVIEYEGSHYLFNDIEFYYHYCPVKILDLEINRVDHHPLGR